MNFTNNFEDTEFRSSDGPARPEIQVYEKWSTEGRRSLDKYIMVHDSWTFQ